MKNFAVILLIILVPLLANYLSRFLIEGFTCKTDTGTKIVPLGCKASNIHDKKICYPPKQGQNYEGTPGCNLKKDCDNYHVSNLVYYPRYRQWWRYLYDVKTRPEYERIFPPYWNTHYDPNITSDIYYEKVAADHIMPLSRKSPFIKTKHDSNFNLRNLF